MIYFHVFNLKVCSNTITQGYGFFLKKGVVLRHVQLENTLLLISMQDNRPFNLQFISQELTGKTGLHPFFFLGVK